MGASYWMECCECGDWEATDKSNLTKSTYTCSTCKCMESKWDVPHPPNWDPTGERYEED